MARVRSVTVAPSAIPTAGRGSLRGIYRSAEIDPPAEEKVERIEATFLPEGVLVARGYEVLKWPAAAGEMIWREEAPEAGDRAALLKVLTSGAEAVLMLRGRSECREIHHCVAEVEMKLIDAEGGSVLWKSRAEGETLIGQGNEMLAAVEEAPEAVVGAQIRLDDLLVETALEDPQRDDDQRREEEPFGLHAPLYGLEKEEAEQRPGAGTIQKTAGAGEPTRRRQ